MKNERSVVNILILINVRDCASLYRHRQREMTSTINTIVRIEIISTLYSCWNYIVRSAIEKAVQCIAGRVGCMMTRTHLEASLSWRP